jgi:hypothetical protein
MTTPAQLEQINQQILALSGSTSNYCDIYNQVVNILAPITSRTYYAFAGDECQALQIFTIVTPNPDVVGAGQLLNAVLQQNQFCQWTISTFIGSVPLAVTPPPLPVAQTQFAIGDVCPPCTTGSVIVVCCDCEKKKKKKKKRKCKCQKDDSNSSSE